MKVVIYTAVTKANYDFLKEPVKNQEFNMVCYSNQTELTQHTSWDLLNLPSINLEPVRMARYLKHNPHILFPQYDWSIWVDASLKITGNLSELINHLKLHNSVFGIYKHPVRNCIYEAAKKCIAKNKDNKEIILKQINKYKRNGYQANQGLVASGVLVRNHHSSKVIEFQNNWWTEISNHSRRDQLSFNYLAWKNNFKYNLIEGNIGDGKYFLRNKHNINHYN